MNYMRWTRCAINELQNYRANLWTLKLQALNEVRNFRREPLLESETPGFDNEGNEGVSVQVPSTNLLSSNLHWNRVISVFLILVLFLLNVKVNIWKMLEDCVNT